MEKKPQQPAPLEARKDSPLAAFESLVGKPQILNKNDPKDSALAFGFYCSICRASFTSSDAYLDHCNGRLHLRNTGTSHRVERVDQVDRVKARLESLSRQKKHTESIIELDAAQVLQKRLDQVAAEEAEAKQAKKAAKKAKKNAPEPAGLPDENHDQDLISAMGFKSFV